MPGPVVVPFSAPACARCAGHRGVTLAVPVGTPFPSPVRGKVTFSGSVAGRRFVTVAPGSGVLVTVGDLAGAAPAVGAEIASGEPIGTSAGRVYVGVRERGLAVDPARVLGSWRARLVAPPASPGCPLGVGEPSR